MNKPIKYTLIKEDKRTAARLGIIETPHSTFETPIFMPVGTKANVKTLIPEEVKEMTVEELEKKLGHKIKIVGE